MFFHTFIHRKRNFLLLFFISVSSFSQQIGDGFAPYLNDFSLPLKSGVFGGVSPNGSTPDLSHPWQHLFVTRHGNPENNNQLQIGASFNTNDRLFFRKIATSLQSSNPNWIEIATRGSNNFNGNQTINGTVGVGTTNPRANLDIAKDISNGQLGIVFGRLSEGDNAGSGTFLGVKGYATQGADPHNIKSFSIIHDFYGKTNSSINFYRGGDIAGGFITFNTNDNTEKIRIVGNGNVGIGTTSPAHKLDVIGTIRSREIKVDMNGADFVFEEKYPLMPLAELEAFIKKNKHLPEIAPAKEMQEQGSNLGDLNTKLLQKIEELTLYTIEQNKKLELQNEKIIRLEQKIEQVATQQRIR